MLLFTCVCGTIYVNTMSQAAGSQAFGECVQTMMKQSKVMVNIFTESTHDKLVASRVYDYRFVGIHTRGGGADDSL